MKLLVLKNQKRKWDEIFGGFAQQLAACHSWLLAEYWGQIFEHKKTRVFRFGCEFEHLFIYQCLFDIAHPLILASSPNDPAPPSYAWLKSRPRFWRSILVLNIFIFCTSFKNFKIETSVVFAVCNWIRCKCTWLGKTPNKKCLECRIWRLNGRIYRLTGFRQSYREIELRLWQGSNTKVWKRKRASSSIFTKAPYLWNQHMDIAVNIWNLLWDYQIHIAVFFVFIIWFFVRGTDLLRWIYRKATGKQTKKPKNN